MNGHRKLRMKLDITQYLRAFIKPKRSLVSVLYVTFENKNILVSELSPSFTKDYHKYTNYNKQFTEILLIGL